MVELIEFICGRCDAVNRLKMQAILSMQGSPKCGSCKQPLLRAIDEPLSGLDPASYTHPEDREALAALQRVPGFKRFFKAIIKNSFEQYMRLNVMANYLKVDETQLPSLYRRFQAAAERLGIAELPELYVYQSPVLNAYTAGVEKTFVCMSTACLELLTEEEQQSVLAHELGHVHAAHVLYKTATWVCAMLATTVADMTIGIGSVFVKPIQLALARWDRASELTADRAQLLVTRKPEVVLRTLMKMAGASPSVVKELNIQAFIKQAEAFEQARDDSVWTQVMVAFQAMDRSHPFSVYRAKEVIEFVSQGEFLEILDGDYTRRSLVNTSPCPRCGKPLPDGAGLCAHCAYGTEGADGEADGAAADAAGQGLGDKLDKGVEEARQWFKKTFGE